MKFLSQIVLIVAVIATFAGGVFLLTRSPSSGDVQLILPTVTSEPVVELAVYISGAIRNPGVYTVNEGDRLASVIEAAGGATDDADLTAVNLAVRLHDEDHWHVPVKGESPQSSPAQAPLSRNASPSAKININAADTEQLKSLPGIGEVKANAIVSYRNANGPFPTVEHLLDVSGIGTATLESIRDLVEAR